MQNAEEFPTLITSDEVCDLYNALDILMGAYASGVTGPEVQDLLKRYAYGTPANKRVRDLYKSLPILARVPLDLVL
jgi:hypothetical protein